MPETTILESFNQYNTAVSSTKSTRTWHRFALVGIVLLAVFLHFFRLEQEGYANLYYAAAVKSMLSNWHNFFFVSFDPGGFVTVDKPPLGLWVQTASAALFGFNGLSLLLPQALAGVLSVILLYHLVRRVFGPTAGLLAALILAVTPISVAANRNNTMDSQLVLLLLLAAWAISRAAETGRLRWLLLCVVLVGLGFNVKMLQAFLVLPAFYLLYLVAAPLPWWKRLLHLTLATVVLLVVSLSWAVLVDLTPPEERPFIGSSQNNTVMELIIGHNGLKRLLPGGLRALFRPSRLPVPPRPQPRAPRPGSQAKRPVAPPPSNRPNQPPPTGPGSQPGQPPVPAQGSKRPFSHEIGEPGLLRLFSRPLAGQISWLLPLAGLCLVAAAWQTRLRFPLEQRHQALLLWSAWLVPQVVFFSIANMFHRYYLEMLAPAIAALVGAGLVAMWKDYHRPGWRGWLLPLALVGSAFVEAYILAEFPEWSRWLTPLVVGLCLATAAVLSILRVVRRSNGRLWSGLAMAIGVLALLIPMAVWAFIPVWYGGEAGLPFAGPDVINTHRRDELSNVEPLADYLLANRQGETFIVATLNARTAAPIILATGEPVMALGGFSGGDRILTVDELADLVENGAVRFFLLPRQAGKQTELAHWVVQHCTPVAPQSWLPMPSRSGRQPSLGPDGIPQLFDCCGAQSSRD